MSQHPEVFAGRIENGHIKLETREAFAALISRLEGKEIELRLAKRRKPRSLSQNAYYWSVVVASFSEASGYEPEEAHIALKCRFLQVHTDDGLVKVRSTSDLSTAEFTEFIEQCRRLAAMMFGLNIPDPATAARVGLAA